MSYEFEAGKDKIVQAILSMIEQKLAGKTAKLCAEFASRFLNTIALEDLIEFDIDDLYGALINFWHLYYERAPEETKIRIYNPDFERHGWQTTHTVIEIVHDDMPFLVDSIRMEINRMGLTSHLIAHMGGMVVKRDEKTRVANFLEKTTKEKAEAIMFIEVDRITDPMLLDELHRNFDRILEDNRAVVSDWLPMREKIRHSMQELNKLSKVIDEDELIETCAFLKWIEDHHFTFLGIKDYEIVKKEGDTLLQPIAGSGLGVLSDKFKSSSSRSLSAMSPEAREFILSKRILVLSKTNRRSSVHRDTHTDYIGIKMYNTKGEVVGERRIIGLFTAAAYNTNPKYIPILRKKVESVMNMSKLDPKSHAGKVLLNILETLPRDDLIQGSENELLEIGMGIYHMQERRKIRMFARKDIYRRFVSCLVYVPKERFHTELRQAIHKVLSDSFNSSDITFTTRFSDSVLARIHFIVRTDPNDETQWDFKEIEKSIIEVGRSWSDDLKQYLLESLGEEQGNKLYCQYKDAFPVAYRDNFNARTAVYDINHIEILGKSNVLSMNLFKPVEDWTGNLRFKVYQHEDTLPLTDVLPILENLGLRAISERPYELKNDKGRVTWINDFYLNYTYDKDIVVDSIKDLFQEAFARIWLGDAENDGFNKLVLLGGFNWRQVAILRTYAKYFKQIGFTFSQEYIETTLINQNDIAKKLIQLFEVRFDPKNTSDREKISNELVSDILNDLEEVSNLDEDKIVRQYLHAIMSTLRTNYYQRKENGGYKAYISVKLNTKAMPGVPLPHPMFEIFVYSPRFEGVHLRCGKVARGGLRWSDRKEDFRTEILGLMKAQQVKNSVIVPNGAKGGFVPRSLPVEQGREAVMAEGIACYKLFIRGLLDITDNYKGGEIIKPDSVVCYDEDDHYLVVAADKGTATFSDIANEISAEYDFWLGDAFASGGSIGYDHKKMGITAKGAWESVKRHFRELGRDIQNSDFTCVGIGDMAGDVFGNGMLLSKHTQLVGAFNHLHIFIDPKPDVAKSYKERKRLFELPRSSWADYNEELISKGGGVFNRSAKYISVTPEMKALFNISESRVEPNELIRYMLKSKVDLVWSAGIGTFVKSTIETNSDAGDRTNDAIRINAQELRCKVVGEGGNLGLTQLGRVEYALNGGLIYTDFIDNSAGVDCSDNEVNIKILLDQIVENGDITVKQRNALLAKMTDEVGKLVLRDNYSQTQAISLAAAQALRNIELHGRYIEDLERTGKLDRSLEFLPDNQALNERKLSGKGLTRPGIAVLLCYSKTILNEQIVQTDIPEDKFLIQVLEQAFPKPLREQFSQQMQSHPLKREIIATKLSNIIINEMGFTFIYRLKDETGAPVSAIVRAYMIARTIFNIDKIWRDIQALDNKISAEKQIEMMMLYIRLIRRTTRWFLRSQRMRLNMDESVKFYGPGVAKLKKNMLSVLGKANSNNYQNYIKNYTELGVNEKLAHELASTRPLFSALDIIEAANELGKDIEEVAKVYFGLGEFLDLTWVRTQVIMHPTDNHWEALSREALRDDLDWQQRQLTAGIIRGSNEQNDLSTCINSWAEDYSVLIERWRYMLTDLRASTSLNYTMFFVAIRELLDLTQTTIQVSTKEDMINA